MDWHSQEVDGISGFLWYFRVFMAQTHEWTDFVRRLVAVAEQNIRKSGPISAYRLGAITPSQRPLPWGRSPR